MSGRLEDYIRSNRDAFDDKEPPESVWQKIEKEIPARKPAPWYDNLLLWRAAAVLFLGLSLYLLMPKSPAVSENSKVAQNEFSDVEAFYTTQISEKVAMIEEITKGESADEFTLDFQQLEAMYNVLKEDWKTRPSKKVKDAMVLNLLVRINLLNEQLHRIEEETEKEQKATDSSI